MSATAKKRKQQKSQGFTAEEKAAMRARARELKAAEDGESAVRAALAAMAPHDRAIGKRLHALVKESAPDLSPKTWYGMPAYANKDGKVVCYFKNSGKFKMRYSELGFNDTANLDDAVGGAEPPGAAGADVHLLNGGVLAPPFGDELRIGPDGEHVLARRVEDPLDPDLELARGGDRGLVHQLTACFTSFAIFASSAFVSFVSA